MKKVFFMAMVSFAILLMTGNAPAYSYLIYDHPDDALEVYHGQFESYGIDAEISGGMLDLVLQTDYDGDETVGGWTTWYADLAIDMDQDGTYEYGLDLANANWEEGQATLYSNPTWLSADDNWAAQGSPGGLTWNHEDNVTIASGTEAGSAQVQLGDELGNDWWIYLTIDLDDLGGLGENGFNLYWATATCANDPVEGAVPAPEPATMLLLGSGLIGLGGYRRKFRKK